MVLNFKQNEKYRLVSSSTLLQRPFSMQSEVPAFLFGTFATLALALGIAAWMTVSHLLLGMQATERLVWERRQARDFHDRMTNEKIARLSSAELFCQISTPKNIN